MPNNSTVHKSKDEYGDDYFTHLLEQYKIVRGAIVDLQNDRNAHSRFIFAILTALFGFSGFVAKEVFTGSPEKVEIVSPMFFPGLFGIAVSIIWICLISSYEKGMQHRYTVLKDIEVELPSNPFTREYELRDKDYLKLSKILEYLAWVFICLNAFLVGFSLYLLIRLIPFNPT